MFPITRYGRTVAKRLQNSITHNRFGQSLLLGLGATLCFSAGAQAAETITIRYLDDTITVPVSNLETYARTGEAQTPEVREFFERHSELGQIVQDALTTQIYISEAFLQDTLNSSVGEFVLVKLNELIGSPSWREDLQPLRTALLDAYQDDNSFSILEVIQDLPDEDINLNLSGLEPVYRDVRAFVERIYPALEVAKDFLQDLVCDCQTTPAASESDSTAPSSSSESGSPQSALPGGDRTVLTAQNCNNATQARTTQAHTTQVTPIPHSVSTTATAATSVLAEPARP